MNSILEFAPYLLVGFFIYKWHLTELKLKMQIKITQEYENRTFLMSKELEGIMSLQKFAIDRWSSSVKERENMIYVNNQLAKKVQDLEQELALHTES